MKINKSNLIIWTSFILVILSIVYISYLGTVLIHEINHKGLKNVISEIWEGEYGKTR